MEGFCFTWQSPREVGVFRSRNSDDSSGPHASRPPAAQSCGVDLSALRWWLRDKAIRASLALVREEQRICSVRRCGQRTLPLCRSQCDARHHAMRRQTTRASDRCQFQVLTARNPFRILPGLHHDDGYEGGCSARAHAVHPISDVQIEFSLFSRNPEDTIIPTCRALGIGITAYGVLSHGLLTGRLDADDAGAPPHLPRLHGENRRTNIALADRLRPIADRLGASIAQLAIAWVLAQGAEHADVLAIVGAGRPDHIADNLTAAHLELSHADLADIEHAVPRSAGAGARYAAPLMAMLDSEQQSEL